MCQNSPSFCPENIRSEGFLKELLSDKNQPSWQDVGINKIKQISSPLNFSKILICLYEWQHSKRHYEKTGLPSVSFHRNLLCQMCYTRHQLEKYSSILSVTDSQGEEREADFLRK